MGSRKKLQATVQGYLSDFKRLDKRTCQTMGLIFPGELSGHIADETAHSPRGSSIRFITNKKAKGRKESIVGHILRLPSERYRNN